MEGFTKFIVPYYVGKSDAGEWQQLKMEVEAGPDAFLTRIRRLLAFDRRYAAQSGWDHNYILAILLFLLFKVTGWRCAWETSVGRIDMVPDGQVRLCDGVKLEQECRKGDASDNGQTLYRRYLVVPAGVPHRRELCQKDQEH